MITRLSDQDKKRALVLYLNGMSLNDIRFNLVEGKEVAQKAVRTALIENGYAWRTYCYNCNAYRQFVSAVYKQGREFCTDCGKYL